MWLQIYRFREDNPILFYIAEIMPRQMILVRPI